MWNQLTELINHERRLIFMFHVSMTTCKEHKCWSYLRLNDKKHHFNRYLKPEISWVCLHLLCFCSFLTPLFLSLGFWKLQTLKNEYISKQLSSYTFRERSNRLKFTERCEEWRCALCELSQSAAGQGEKPQIHSVTDMNNVLWMSWKTLTIVCTSASFIQEDTGKE